MKPNVDDDIREFSYGALLAEIDRKMLDTGKETISSKDIILILRCTFGYEDSRSHRNKLEMCLGKSYLARINKTAFRLTEKGYERIRLARGVPPEANTEAPIAVDPSATELFESTEENVNSYLTQLQRGGRQA